MHRRTPLLWVLIAQVGCSSTWILDVDAALQCTEDRKLSWWQDNDGDGWGQGVDADGVAVEPIRECDGFQDAALVRNGLDCDDTTANLADTVTGAISGFCPLDLVYNPTPPQTIQYVGLRSAEDEYVAFYGTTPLDWPDDDEGNLQDLDGSSEDLYLTPYLEIRSNTRPEETLLQSYGIT